MNLPRTGLFTRLQTPAKSEKGKEWGTGLLRPGDGSLISLHGRASVHGGARVTVAF